MELGNWKIALALSLVALAAEPAFAGNSATGAVRLGVTLVTHVQTNVPQPADSQISLGQNAVMTIPMQTPIAGRTTTKSIVQADEPFGAVSLEAPASAPSTVVLVSKTYVME